MADIELVIKIPEGLKKDFESEQWTALSCMEMKDALMNGTPLPKGHGRLIDADKLYQRCLDIQGKKKARYFDIDDVMQLIKKQAPTVMEASKDA